MFRGRGRTAGPDPPCVDGGSLGAWVRQERAGVICRKHPQKAALQFGFFQCLLQKRVFGVYLFLFFVFGTCASSRFQEELRPYQKLSLLPLYTPFRFLLGYYPRVSPSLVFPLLNIFTSTGILYA